MALAFLQQSSEFGVAFLRSTSAVPNAASSAAESCFHPGWATGMNDVSLRRSAHQLANAKREDGFRQEAAQVRDIVS